MGDEKVGPEMKEGGRTWREVTVPVPWGSLTGKWWGSRDKQPILALHGWQDNCGTWDRLMPLLPDDIPIFCVDFPGHGFSSHYPRGQCYYIFWDGPLVIRRLVQYYKWQRITILGHSLGGITGFMYASLFPNDIERLIQIDIAGPTIKSPEEIPAFSSNIIDKFLEYENHKEENAPVYKYDSMIEIVEEAHRFNLTRETCQILMRRGIVSAKNGDGYVFSRDPRLKVGGLALVSEEVALKMASLIKCPVLNIRAVPGLFPRDTARGEYYTKIVNKMSEHTEVHCHEVNGTHHVHLNTPEVLLNLIVQFLCTSNH